MRTAPHLCCVVVERILQYQAAAATNMSYCFLLSIAHDVDGRFHNDGHRFWACFQCGAFAWETRQSRPEGVHTFHAMHFVSFREHTETLAAATNMSYCFLLSIAHDVDGRFHNDGHRFWACFQCGVFAWETRQSRPEGVHTFHAMHFVSLREHTETLCVATRVVLKGFFSTGFTSYFGYQKTGDCKRNGEFQAVEASVSITLVVRCLFSYWRVQWC